MTKPLKKETKKGWAVVGTYKGLNTDDPWNYRNQAMIYKTKTAAQFMAPGGFVVVRCEITYPAPTRK